MVEKEINKIIKDLKIKDLVVTEEQVEGIDKKGTDKEERTDVIEITYAMERILVVITKLESKKDSEGNQITPCTKREVYTRRLKRNMTLDVWKESIEKLLSPGGGLYKNISIGRLDGRGGRTTETFNTYKKL